MYESYPLVIHTRYCSNPISLALDIKHELNKKERKKANEYVIVTVYGL
jgi:hypothetical protein